MSEIEYLELKEYFKQKKTFEIFDNRKCADFFAGWWKFEYVEGKPSKELVFNSIGLQNDFITSDEFYKNAKAGGYSLGLKWIRNENTLYFRTLLLQGRIPIKSLIRFNTYWKKFLVKVIEKRPIDISDISNDLDIIRLLPLSTRNESIYESALEISKAIWDDSEDGKKILEILEQNEQRDLVNSLRIEKEKIKSRKQTQIKLKPFWELNYFGDNKAEISLKIDLPNKLQKDAFASLINTDLNELSNSYNLFCDDYLLAAYKKNLNGDYLKYSTSNYPLVWNNELQQIPLIYFANNEGTKYYVPNQLKAIPSAAVFSFWIQMEENRWMMINGNNLKDDKAFLLTANSNLLVSFCKSFIVENHSLYFYEVNQNSLAEINEKLSIDFKLCQSTFDWTIISDMPNWMHRANMNVVNKMPKIYFYDEDNNTISDNEIKIAWKKKNEINWSSGKSIPFGIVELQFSYKDLIEYDKVFSIGNSTFKYDSTKVNNASIYFQHDSLKLSIFQNDLYEINSTTENKSIIEFNKINQIPKRIKGSISYKNENLIIEIISPVKGFEIIDNNDKIVESNHEFILNNLFGYRIVCGENQNIKFYNEQNPDILIRQKLNAGSISLRNFQGIIQKLFSLADSMSAKNKVIMEIGGKIYFFQTYNSRLKFKDDRNLLVYANDNRLLISVKQKGFEANDDLELKFNLFAVPLNCVLTNINVIELEKNENGFSFPNTISDTEFLVFDNDNAANCKILPTYISTIQDNYFAPDEYLLLKEKKENKIAYFASNLNNSSIDSEDWISLFKYIKICIQNNIPFSALDNIRASCTSSSLSAKLFFCLLLNTDSNEEFIKACEKIEDELGFKFHWCSFNSFELAINWLYDTWANLPITDIFAKANLFLDSKFLNFDKNDWKFNLHLNSEISSMRARLGENIINELPTKYPWIKEDRKAIIPFPNEIPKLKIMARSPIAIGLTKCDVYISDLPLNENKLDLWNLNNHGVRRNIIYSQQIDPTWYDIAITYTINKLNQNEL
ncbi:MAG: hypothetical protein IPP32_16540 [Bacteroidetes bacterium]|nr:hypothetical protein [Bacteroidota bacterium]